MTGIASKMHKDKGQKFIKMLEKAIKDILNPPTGGEQWVDNDNGNMEPPGVNVAMLPISRISCRNNGDIRPGHCGVAAPYWGQRGT